MRTSKTSGKAASVTLGASGHGYNAPNMVQQTFADKLNNAWEQSRSLVCVGLDPDPRLMPIPEIATFNRAIVDATWDLVCAYKPNLAFYEALGMDGLQALEATLVHIREVAPRVVLLGDAKRGDIGSTAQAYATAMFDSWGVDALTASPYLGADSVEPFIERPDKGVFLICRTSNPGSADFQALMVQDEAGAKPLYQVVAERASGWNRHRNVGLVVGATQPEELDLVREMHPQMPILIPGVGAQGGELESAVRSGVDPRGRGAIINSSRGVIYASKRPDFAEAARREASRLRDAINGILEQEGKGWS